MLRPEPPISPSRIETAVVEDAPIDRRAEARFPTRVVVVAVVVLSAHGVGLLCGAYVYFTRLDDVMHAFGGFLAAWGLTAGYPYAAARGWIGATDAWTRSVLVLGLVAIVAVTWECFEFSCDRLIRTGFQGSVLDTMSDLMLGLCGGALYLAVALRRDTWLRKQ